MTITTEHAHTSTMTISEIRERVGTLLEEAGMSRDEMDRQAASFGLGARHRGIFAEIEGLEWLMNRAETARR